VTLDAVGDGAGFVGETVPGAGVEAGLVAEDDGTEALVPDGFVDLEVAEAGGTADTRLDAFTERR